MAPVGLTRYNLGAFQGIFLDTSYLGSRTATAEFQRASFCRDVNQRRLKEDLSFLRKFSRYLESTNFFITPQIRIEIRDIQHILERKRQNLLSAPDRQKHQHVLDSLIKLRTMYADLISAIPDAPDLNSQEYARIFAAAKDISSKIDVSRPGEHHSHSHITERGVQVEADQSLVSIALASKFLNRRGNYAVVSRDRDFSCIRNRLLSYFRGTDLPLSNTLIFGNIKGIYDYNTLLSPR